MKKIILGLAFLLSLPSVVKAQFSYQEAVKKLNDMVGLAAPNFEGTTIEGKKVSLAELKGKIVVVNFWFVGCVPCEQEMPLLNRVRNTYKDRSDIVFLSFAKTDEATLKKFLNKHPFLYETVPSANPIAENYNVTAYPCQFIVDQSGLVRFTSIGGRDDIDQILTNKINALLN